MIWKIEMNIWGFIFTSIFYFLEISVYLTTVQWIYKLEKSNCECSNTFHKKYIKKWCQLYIIIITIIYIYHIYITFNDNNTDKIRMENRTFAFQIPLTFLSFINVIISIHYIDKLKKNNCTCSKSLARETYYIFNWLRIILLCFFGFLLLILTLGISYQLATNKNISWWFSFQNSKIEISNSDKNTSTISFKSVSRKKPRNIMSLSVPSVPDAPKSKK